jgi:hypothetical protein
MEAAKVRAGQEDNRAPGVVTPSACSIFLEDHAAYIDDVMDAQDAAAHEAHAHECEACARYARVLDRGLRLVHELPEIEPSAYFEERLRHRIFHIEDDARLERDRGRSATGLAAAALIALIAWSPMLWRNHASSNVGRVSYATSAASPATASTRYDYSDANDIAALREQQARRPSWYAHPADAALEQAPVHRIVSVAGSYSPLIVSPPAARGPRAVRLVSAITQ